MRAVARDAYEGLCGRHYIDGRLLGREVTRIAPDPAGTAEAVANILEAEALRRLEPPQTLGEMAARLERALQTLAVQERSKIARGLDDEHRAADTMRSLLTRVSRS